MLGEYEILQIMPAAPGFEVGQDDGEWTMPVVCWALIRHEEGWTGVEPMIVMAGMVEVADARTHKLLDRGRGKGTEVGEYENECLA